MSLVKIKDVCKINPSKEKADGKVSFLKMEDVAVDGRILNKEEREYSDVSTGFSAFKDKDVLVAKITPCFENGKGAYVENLLNGIGFGSTEFHVVRADESKVLSKYLFYNLNSEAFRKYGEIHMTGSAGQKRIPKDYIESYKIYLPSLLQQKKIISIMESWDLTIEKQEILIEKKKKFKIGLMQRLLSGEVRFKEFNEKWKKARLDKYIEPISRECDKPSEGYWRLGLRSHGKGTFHQFVDDPTKVSMDKLYKVKANDLIVNITFAWEHAIAVANSEDEEKLVSHRFPTYEFKVNAYPEYFKYYILQSRFREMLVNISPGGAGRNRVMNKKDFLKLEVLIPSYDEQRRIAEVLISADKEIELLEKELEALKLQKKGLMQRLLTGEVRVKV